MDFSIKSFFAPKTESIHVKHTDITFEATKDKWFNRILCGVISAITGKRFVHLEIDSNKVLISIDRLAANLGIAQAGLEAKRDSAIQRDVNAKVETQRLARADIEKGAIAFAASKIQQIEQKIGEVISEDDRKPILQKMIDIYRNSYSAARKAELQKNEAIISFINLDKTDYTILVVDKEGLKQPALYLYKTQPGGNSSAQYILLSEEGIDKELLQKLTEE